MNRKTLRMRDSIKVLLCKFFWVKSIINVFSRVENENEKKKKKVETNSK